MKSTYSKTGSRPGKPGYRTSAAFIRRFLNKIKNQKIFRRRRGKNLFKSKYFNNKK